MIFLDIYGEVEITHRRNMIHVWFLHHRPHGLLHRPIRKLKRRVLFPDLLQIEIRAIHVLFQESQRPRVRHAGRRKTEIWMAGDDKTCRGGFWIRIYRLTVAVVILLLLLSCWFVAFTGQVEESRNALWQIPLVVRDDCDNL